MMFDLTKADRRLLDLPDVVVKSILDIEPIDPAGILLVGASCRDLHHSALGCGFGLRRSNDIDLGLALADWEAYGRITAALKPAGDTRLRFYVAGILVDLFPFGGIENPVGTAAPAGRPDGVPVFGFSEVLAESHPLQLPCGATIRLPTIPGYTGLKLKAWTDRSPGHEYKDAQDLAAPVFWYSNAAPVLERLYGTPAGHEILLRYDMDVPEAAAHLLGLDVRAALGPDRTAELLLAWGSSDLDMFVRYFGQREITPWPSSLESRQGLLTALTAGLTGA